MDPRAPASEEESDTAIPDERDLCLQCMAPCDSLAHFCPSCGAPLTPFASTMPFESTFAEGRAYLQAVETPGKFIVVAGIWIIFGPMLVLGVGLLVILDWRALGKLENALSLAGGLALSVIALIVMGRTTLAYWRGRR